MGFRFRIIIPALLGAIFLVGCVVIPQEITETPDLKITTTTAPAEIAHTHGGPLVISQKDALPVVRLLPAGLTWEEHPLVGSPNTEPLTFEPVQGTQAEVLARNAALRAQVFQHRWYGTIKVDAKVETEAVEGAEFGFTQRETIQVYQDKQLIYSMPVGDGSPIGALQGIWTYGNHWAMEGIYRTNFKTSDGSIGTQAAGHLAIDGVLLNESLGYEEIFGFQILNGKPFYFFKKEGQLGLAYAGETVNLNYDAIVHYQCCSAGELNPVAAQDIVAFFATRGEDWYYVEIRVSD